MNSITYENHNLKNSKLPFILHHVDKSFQNFTGTNWHPNIEILYCVKGNFTVISSMKVYEVKKGDIVIINSNSFHKILSASHLEYFCLIPGIDFCNQNGIPVEAIRFDEYLTCPKLCEKFDSIITAYNIDIRNRIPDFSELESHIPEIRYAVLGFLIEIYRHHINSPPSKLQSTVVNTEKIKELTVYIREHFSEKLTLEHLAQSVNLSKYYLSHEFKKLTGLTIFNYINEIRCNEASILIKNGMSVSEAALSVGFDNLSYFSRTYKKHHLLLPSQEKQTKDSH